MFLFFVVFVLVVRVAGFRLRGKLPGRLGDSKNKSQVPKNLYLGKSGHVRVPSAIFCAREWP